MNVTIMHNVTIGDGAVIGANTLLREDVPPYAVVVGNPQKIVKYRFSRDVVESIMKIKWWDWPDEKILASRFYRSSTEEFINRFGTEMKADVEIEQGI